MLWLGVAFVSGSSLAAATRGWTVALRWLSGYLLSAGHRHLVFVPPLSSLRPESQHTHKRLPPLPNKPFASSSRLYLSRLPCFSRNAHLVTTPSPVQILFAASDVASFALVRVCCVFLASWTQMRIGPHSPCDGHSIFCR